MKVLERQIDRVAVIDDSPEARAGYTYTVEDASLIAVDQPGPLPPLEDYRRQVSSAADAALCDYHITVQEYASFDGAELVASATRSGFPMVLCTRWEKAHLERLRHLRRWIPALLRPDELEPDSLVDALNRTVEEIVVGPRPARRPWRALVRVEEVDHAGGRFYVELPGWHSEDVVALMTSGVPAEIRDRLTPGSRHHAQVNLGAESLDDLYFSDWEVE